MSRWDQIVNTARHTMNIAKQQVSIVNQSDLRASCLRPMLLAPCILQRMRCIAAARWWTEKCVAFTPFGNLILICVHALEDRVRIVISISKSTARLAPSMVTNLLPPRLQYLLPPSSLLAILWNVTSRALIPRYSGCGEASR
jgi:hypothetical protein